MSGECMLCRVRRAETPYYIECTGLRVYTIEELLYFMQHNLALLDQTILNEDLVRWIKDELRMRRLAVSLEMLLRRKFTVRDFVLPMFKEAHYPDEKSIREIQKQLSELEELPIPVRMKKKGDLLFGHRRYSQAVEEYDQILELLRGSSSSDVRLAGNIWDSKGKCYAKLFQMEEMRSSFRESSRILQTMDALKKYLASCYLAGGTELFETEAAAAGMDFETKQKWEEEFSSLQAYPAPEDPSGEIRKWIREYHRDTGM